MDTCPICGTTLDEGETICPACLLDQKLEELREWADELREKELDN